MSPAPQITPPSTFTHLTTDQGLSHNSVWAIVRDQQGFMWFGTVNGLNRYDGYTFKIYRADPTNPRSLSSDLIRTLYVDSQGTLWIGTWDNGLNRFNRHTEQFTRYLPDPTDPHSLSGSQVRAIFEDEAGRLWIGTENGLNLLDRAAGHFTHYQHDPADPNSLSHNDIYAISADRAGNLWVGTYGGGVNRFDPDSEDFTAYRHDPDDPHSLSHDEIYLSIYEDRQGYLWISTWQGGLNRFDPATGTFTRYRHDPADPYSLGHDSITSFYEDKAGRLWVATYGGGLNRFDPDTEQFRRYQHHALDPTSLSHDTVLTLYEAEGLLWVGSLGGVSHLDLEAKPFGLYRPDPSTPDSGLSQPDVRALYEDRQGVVWIGTEGDGLNRLNRQSGAWHYYRHDPTDPDSLSSNSVRAIFEDRAGRLWVGTVGGGLNQLDRTSGQFRHYRHDPADPNGLGYDDILDIHQDQTGQLWLATWGGGLDRFDPTTGQFRHYRHDPADPHSLSHNEVFTVSEDQNGTVWIGTRGGLDRFDPATEQFHHYRHDPADPHSLSHNTVLSLHPDQSGLLWVGSFDGLNKFDPGREKFEVYREADGFPGDIVSAILVDDAGQVWVGLSGGGLARFDPQAETVAAYTPEDGVQGNIFTPAAFKTGRGELLFGGRNGFNLFDPARIEPNSYRPPVVLTNFELFNRPVPISENAPLPQAINLTESLTLSYADEVFTFEFAALSYRAPQQNRYRYKLEGFETAWNEVDSDRRFATYTHLDPGSYTFRVTGSNNDGLWNEEGMALHLTITPPWWETWWFQGVVVLLALGLLWTGYQARVQAMADQQRYLEEQVAVRTEALATANEKLQAEIAERQRTEVILREREQFIQNIAEASPVILYVHNVAEERNIYANREVTQILGYTPAEIQAKGSGFIPSLIHPDDLAGMFDFETRRLSSGPGEVVEVEYRLRHKNGAWRWIVSREVVFKRTDEGQVLEVVGVAQDITVRKQAEASLRRYERIVSTTPDAISLVDCNYVYQIVNQAYEMWHGQPADTLIGRSLREIQGTEAFEKHLQTPLDQALAGETVRYRHWFEDSASERRFLEVTYSPYYEPDGTISGVIANIRDLTELEQLHDQLRHSQKLEAVGQLAAGVAHHYNNMLTAIVGFTSLALSELPPDHPVAADLKRVLSTIDRAADLTRQLLTFTRKQEVAPKAVNLNDLIAGFKPMLKQLIPASIELTLDLAPRLGQTRLDVGQFEQLLVNLVVNARDAMPQGGRLDLTTTEVTLAAAEAEGYEVAPGEYVLLSLSDTGSGIEADIQAQVFEPFFTTKEVGQGTGLGLPVCFGIVRQHNGHITIDSQPGQGTTVQVYLPRLDSPSPSTASPPMQELPLGNETILLVEDEATVREWMGRALRRWGYEVFEAEDGEAALQRVAGWGDRPLHLLLSDMVMPKLGGKLLARRLREIYPHLPIVLMSGYTPEQLGPLDLDEATITFLAKPFTLTTLAQTVRRVLDAAKMVG